jgi:hypothetical protein
LDLFLSNGTPREYPDIFASSDQESVYCLTNDLDLISNCTQGLVIISKIISDRDPMNRSILVQASGMS